MHPLDQKMRDKFNNEMASLYDDTRDFLVLHYANNRTDTKFWKMISEHKHLTPLVKDMIEYSKKAVPNFSTMRMCFGHVDHQLWNWTLAGLGYLTPELARKELDNYTGGFNLESQLNKYEILSKGKLTFQQFIRGKNVGEKIKGLEESLANALELNESHQRLNGKLQERLTEVEDENKTMHEHLSKKVDHARRGGF